MYELMDKESKMAVVNDCDVVVKIQSTVTGNYETGCIKDKTIDEVKELLQDAAAFNHRNDIHMDVREYLKQQEIIWEPIIISDGQDKGYASFFDLLYDTDNDSITDIRHMDVVVQTENYIARLDFGIFIISPQERELITEYAFKTGSMERVREFGQKIIELEINSPNLVVQEIIGICEELTTLTAGMLSMDEMYEYGYFWGEMIPVTKEKALNLFNQNMSIYLLHEDNTEVLAEDAGLIHSHKGMYGVEQKDWYRYIRTEQENGKVISDFKEKTKELFQKIAGQNAEEIEQMVLEYLKEKITEYKYDIQIVRIAITGSRCRGLEKDDSDLDIVVEYEGDFPEDELFHIFNKDGLKVSDVRVDINPITAGKTGTLADYLLKAEKFLEQKKEMQAKQKNQKFRKRKVDK